MDEDKPMVAEEPEEMVSDTEDDSLLKAPSNDDASSIRSTHDSEDEDMRPATPPPSHPTDTVTPSDLNELPHRHGIVWKIGSKVEAKDFLDKWYPAKIADVDKSDSTVLIHFEGWNQRYDEWLSMNSEDIRPSTRHSERSKIKTSSGGGGRSTATMIHKAGEYVFAKWTDCRMYPAKVTRVNTHVETYEVLFYDGVRKTVQAINVRAMSLEVQQEYSKVGLLPDLIRKRSKDGIIDERLLSPMLKEASLKAEKSVNDEEQLRRREAKRKRSSTEENPAKRLKTEPMAKPQTSETFHKPKQRPESVKSMSSLPTDVPQQIEATEDDDAAFLPQVTSALDSGVSSVSEKDMKVLPPTEDMALPVLDLLTSKLKVARKEFKVEEDHNHFKCPHVDCGKSFRKKSLVNCHIKHYHPGDLPLPLAVPHPQALATTPHAMVQGSGASVPRRRKQTISMCSTDSDISIGSSAITTVPPSGGSSSRSRRKRETTASLSSLSQCVTEGTSDIGDNVVVGDNGSGDATSLDVPSRRLSAPAEVTSKVTTDDVTTAVTGVTEDADDSMSSSVNKEEVVNCVCRHGEDTGLMIQCEVCLCWQHAKCVQLSEVSLPRKYICWLCLDPPGLRESARYKYDQDWLWHGSMATFGFLHDADIAPSSAQRNQIMAATHSLISDMHGVTSALNTIRRQIHVLGNKKSTPELLAWARTWQREKAESAPQAKTEPVEPADDWLKIEPEAEENASHENHRTLIGSIKKKVNVAVGEDNDTEEAYIERHLLDGIDQSHSQLESNVDLIEQQIVLLEAGESNANSASNTADQRERTIRSLRQILGDLADVRKIATLQ